MVQQRCFFPLNTEFAQRKDRLPWRHRYSSPTCQTLQRTELVQLQPFYPQPDFDHFFLTDPHCIHPATSKRGSSSITSRASSEPSKLISPDLSNAKRWVERSLSLVGSDAAALVADWLCTLSVIDLGGHSSRQWLQGKAQLALLEALLGKLPKVSFCILDLCSG